MYVCLNICVDMYMYRYRISSNKRQALINCHSLISPAPLNTALIRIVTIFY